MKRTLSPKINILDPQHLINNEKLLLTIDYKMFDPKVSIHIFQQGQFLCFWSEVFNIFSNQMQRTQTEFPIGFLSWFVKTIEEKFWSDGPNALPPDSTSYTEEISGEVISINAARHCCAENMFGYIVRNNSRVSHLVDLPPQSWEIPRIMLREEKLLEELKTIANIIRSTNE